MQKSKVVVDTNILISAFAFGGIAKKAAKRIFSFYHSYVSSQLLAEYRETPLELERRGKIDSYQLEVLIAGIAAFVSRAKFVVLKKGLSICRDKEDNLVLECCLEAAADFLITGDKDLLTINITQLPKKLSNIKILSPYQFIRIENI